MSCLGYSLVERVTYTLIPHWIIACQLLTQDTSKLKQFPHRLKVAPCLPLCFCNTPFSEHAGLPPLQWLQHSPQPCAKAGSMKTFVSQGVPECIFFSLKTVFLQAQVAGGCSESRVLTSPLLPSFQGAKCSTNTPHPSTYVQGRGKWSQHFYVATKFYINRIR